MKPASLKFILSRYIAAFTLIIVFSISIASNFLISSSFERYVANQQKLEADEIAQNISSQYNGGWNIDYIHGMGMYALNDGYIIKLQDKNSKLLWDAENHDMTLCHDVMQSISLLMEKQRPDLNGKFSTHRYNLQRHGEITGYLDISYYSPYYMRENDFQFISALNYVLLAVGGAALISAVIISVFIAGRISRPLIQTVELTKKISAGNYDVKFYDDVHTKELSELVKAVNQMAASLKEQKELRSRLTSDIAHELRTPIANLSSYIEMMLEKVFQPTQERLTSCYGEVKRISELISDIDKLNQLVKSELIKIPVDILTLAKNIMNGFESKLQEHNIKGEVLGKSLIIQADAKRIEQVIANLVSNAIKYSKPNGAIKIIIDEDKANCIIMVEDDGIGIQQKDLSRIFERFYRADASRTRKTGGAGIGLAIAKAIIEAHDGKIQAQSKENEGSKFIIALPK